MQQSQHLGFWARVAVALILPAALESSLAAQAGANGAEPLESSFAAEGANRPLGKLGESGDEITFVLGNLEYVLVHEIAHFLIAEKDIPIIGPVESAADYIATLALIREEPLDPTQRDRAKRFLLATARAFAASWQIGNERGAAVPYWGAHALSIQRYYEVLCLLYGSDPAAFAGLPQSAGIPAAKAESCIAEYARADRAVDWLLQTYGKQPGDAPSAATEIVYERPATAVSANVLRELRSIDLLERVMGRLQDRFTIEHPFKLVMRGCGQSEAAWLSDRRELVICYELVDTLYELGRRAEAMKQDRPRARDRASR